MPEPGLHCQEGVLGKVSIIRGQWMGGTKPICNRWKHKPVLVNKRLRTEAGNWKVEKCAKCGAMRYTEVK